MSTQYVYLTSNQGGGMYLHTVGFYDPNGRWMPESDHSTADDAAQRVAYLNGAPVPEKKDCLSPEKIADEAIAIFLEYRDKHGKTEEQARACATNDVMDAIAAIEEERRYGKWHQEYEPETGENTREQEQGIEL